MATRIIDDDAEGIVALAFAADDRLVGVDDLGTLFVWDLTGDDHVRHELEVEPCYGLALSPDGRRATLAGAPVLEVDVMSGATLRQLDTPAPGQSAAYVGDRLLVAAEDGMLRSYDGEQGSAARAALRVGERTSSIVALEDGRAVATSASQGGSRLYFFDPVTLDLDDLTSQADLPVDTLSGAAASEPWVAAGGRDLLLFSLAERRWVGGLDAAGRVIDGPTEGSVLVPDLWTAAARLDDGRVIAAAPNGDVWAYLPGQPPERLTSQPAGLTALAARAGRVATGAVDGRVSVLTVAK